MTEEEKYNNFINEIKGYTDEQLLGEDNGIGDERAILLLTAIMSGTLLMCIGLTIFVYLMVY